MKIENYKSTDTKNVVPNSSQQMYRFINAKENNGQDYDFINHSVLF